MIKLQYENIVREDQIDPIINNIAQQFAARLHEAFTVTLGSAHPVIGREHAQIKIDVLVIDRTYFKGLFGPLRILIGEEAITLIENGVREGKSDTVIVNEVQQLLTPKEVNIPKNQPVFEAIGEMQDDDLEDWSIKDTLNSDDMEQKTQPLAFEDKSKEQSQSQGQNQSEQQPADVSSSSEQIPPQNVGEDPRSVEQVLKDREGEEGGDEGTEEGEKPDKPARPDNKPPDTGKPGGPARPDNRPPEEGGKPRPDNKPVEPEEPEEPEEPDTKPSKPGEGERQRERKPIVNPLSGKSGKK